VELGGAEGSRLTLVVDPLPPPSPVEEDPVSTALPLPFLGLPNNALPLLPPAAAIVALALPAAFALTALLDPTPWSSSSPPIAPDDLADSLAEVRVFGMWW
jgi:hypothetical protein